RNVNRDMSSGMSRLELSVRVCASGLPRPTDRDHPIDPLEQRMTFRVVQRSQPSRHGREPGTEDWSGWGFADETSATLEPVSHRESRWRRFSIDPAGGVSI